MTLWWIVVAGWALVGAGAAAWAITWRYDQERLGRPMTGTNEALRWAPLAVWVVGTLVMAVLAKP